MKKYSLIFILVLMLIVVCGCSKIKIYKVDEERTFIDEIYKHISKSKNDYFLVDARELNTKYASGHFRGFINYDIKNGTIDEFLYKIESLYAKNKTAFIIDEDGEYVEMLATSLKDAGYKKIYIYRRI